MSLSATLVRAHNANRCPEGVVTLSLIDWNLPTAADFDAWDFKGLACRSIVHIGPISLNVTMPTASTEQARYRDNTAPQLPLAIVKLPSSRVGVKSGPSDRPTMSFGLMPPGTLAKALRRITVFA